MASIAPSNGSRPRQVIPTVHEQPAPTPLPSIPATRRALNAQMLREAIAAYEAAVARHADVEAAGGDQWEQAESLSFSRIRDARAQVIRGMVVLHGMTDKTALDDAHKRYWPPRGAVCNGRYYLVTARDPEDDESDLKPGDKEDGEYWCMRLLVMDRADVIDLGDADVIAPAPEPDPTLTEAERIVLVYVRALGAVASARLILWALQEKAAGRVPYEGPAVAPTLSDAQRLAVEFVGELSLSRGDVIRRLTADPTEPGLEADGATAALAPSTAESDDDDRPYIGLPWRRDGVIFQDKVGDLVAVVVEDHAAEVLERIMCRRDPYLERLAIRSEEARGPGQVEPPPADTAPPASGPRQFWEGRAGQDLAAAAATLSALLDRIPPLQAEYNRLCEAGDKEATRRFEDEVWDPTEAAMKQAERKLYAALKEAGRSGLALGGKLYALPCSPALKDCDMYPETITVVDMADVEGLEV
jgi:hypothetical protein